MFLVVLVIGLWTGKGFSQRIPAAVIEQVEGELEILHEDSDKGSRYYYFLKANRGRVPLHFTKDPPTRLMTGARVRVRGVRRDGMLTLQSGAESVQTLAAASPNTFGEQHTLVILVNFQDKPSEQPWTVDQVRNLVFSTTSNLFFENSYQQTWLTGDVYGWFTIPISSANCDQLGIANYAQSAAAAAGVQLAGYSRYVYVFPQTPSCQWSGTATVGGNPSQTWINGNIGVQVFAHELGHNFGLHHSHSLVCQGATIGADCSNLEYGDGVDVMGWSPSAHFNAFMKEFLGWLNYGTSPPITTVQSSGTYNLNVFAAADSGPKALKILQGVDSFTGKQVWYYVEYRQPVGFDGILASSTSLMNGSNILNGVIVHTGSPDESSNTSYLLDMTSETYDLYTRDPALTLGRSFFDPYAGLTITPLSLSNTGATVSVSFSNPPCNRANPNVSISPAQISSVQAGSPVSYMVSVSNNDAAGCTAASFSLQSNIPTGWTAAFSSPSVTLNPGGSGSTTLTVTSSSAAADGIYTIGVTATNSVYTTYKNSASANYLIASSLVVSVSSDKASYSANDTVSITTQVRSNGSPVANAKVNLAIIKPNNGAITKALSTDRNGFVVYKTRVKTTDPAGIYQLRADATANARSGNGTGSFTVR